MLLTANSLIIGQFRRKWPQKARILAANRNALCRNITINNYCNRFAGDKTNFGLIWNAIKEKCEQKLITLHTILQQHFNFVMALRVRRMTQVCGLYNRIYSESSVRKLMTRLMVRMMTSRTIIGIRQRNAKTDASFKYLLSLACGMFYWDTQRITDNDLKRTVEEFISVEQQSRFEDYDQNSHSNTLSVSASSNGGNVSENGRISFIEGWEAVIIKENIKVWRKSMHNSNLYQYKVFGTFNDIPARAFFRVQMDTEYRKVWDKLVIKLDVVERESEVSGYDEYNYEDSGNEVLHWVMKYPYPMYSRDYVYVRRARIDASNNVMVLMSRSISHPNIPETKEHVRVMDYTSHMVIKPHKSFDDCGFDYLLTYFDNPRAAFPSPAYNWMASCGVPDFVEKLHLAAFQLHYNDTYKSPKYDKKCFSNASQSTIGSANSNCVYA